MVLRGGPPLIFSAQLHPTFITAPLPGGDFRMLQTTVSLISHDDEEGKKLLIAIADLTQPIQQLNEITELRKKALDRERALELSEKRYRELVEGTDNLVTQVDGEWNLSYVNHVSRKIYGLEPEQCAGLSFLEFVHPDDREATRESFEEWIRNRITGASFENRQINRSEEVKEMLWTINLFYDNDGRLEVANSIGRDITERKQAEQEKERLIEELKQALAKIKTLRGMLPICASCKQIRDDKGYWHQVEVYIQSHTDTEFTHGFCPDCARKLLEGLK